MSEKIVFPKNFGSKKIWGPKKCWTRKKILFPKSFKFKNFLGPIKIAGSKMFGHEIILGLKKFWVRKKFGSKEIWSKKILVHKNYDPKKLGPKCLVKIGPVTAEILLIWTNVARAYVAWTKVTMTVGIF